MCIRDRQWPVRWLGVPDRLETQLVPQRFGLVCVNAGGLQGRGLTKLLQLLRLLLASVSVRRVIRRNAIDVVFTTGGYIAAPAILAARWCGIPVVLHESNAIPGRVTRLLGRFCSAVAIGLPAAAKRIPGSQPVLTGTPVQNDLDEFFALADFANPGVLGTPDAFRKTFDAPIAKGLLRGAAPLPCLASTSVRLRAAGAAYCRPRTRDPPAPIGAAARYRGRRAET